MLYLEPDFEDVLVGAVPLSERRMIAAEVTGIFSPKTDADAAWLDDARLGAPVIRDTDQRRYVYGFGLFAPSAYGEVADATVPLPLRYSWRYDVDASGFDAGTIDRLDSDVRKLDASFGESTFGQRLGTGVRTGLSEVLTDYPERPGRGRRGDCDRRSRPSRARARRRRPSRRPRGESPRREHRARPLARRRVVAGARRRGGGGGRGRSPGRVARDTRSPSCSSTAVAS